MITHTLPNLLLLVAAAWLGLSMARQAAGKLSLWSASVSWNH
jgi:hypothetical protein